MTITCPPSDSILVSKDALYLDAQGRPSLRGSRCSACGEVYFPRASGCARCQATQLEDCDLGRRGTLWSWTVQGFLPKPPYNSGETADTFQPFGVGYVEMPSGIKIHTRLTTRDLAQLCIGAEFDLVLQVYGSTPEGRPLTTFAFRPTTSTEAQNAQ